MGCLILVVDAEDTCSMPALLLCIVRQRQHAPSQLVWAQEVYGKLEEPDGLAGLVRLRSHGPRLQDQVRAHFDHQNCLPSGAQLLTGSAVC